MKVLIIANKYPYPARDGSSIAIMSSIRAWVTAGAEVHLFALNPRKSKVPPDMMPDDLVSHVKTYTFDVITDVNPTGVIYNIFDHRPYHISRFLKKSVARSLETLTQNITFDLVQWEGPFMGEYYPFIKSKNTRHYLRAHNVEHRIWLRMAKHHPNFMVRSYLRLQVRRLRKFELDFCRKMDAVLPISEVDAGFFKSECPGILQHVVLPGVVVDDYPVWREETSGDAAVSLASFDWEPNREGMEWFLKNVADRLNDINITIGGRQMPQQWKKYSHITFKPEVKDAQIFLQSGKINFIPLLSGSGIRIKIVEAVSMGIPLVATGIAAEGSGLTNGREFLEAGTPSEFAEAICRLMKSPELRASLSSGARTFARKYYDLAVIAENLSNFYRQHHT
jgi:polysaccharide biosynthesis protein PslH